MTGPTFRQKVPRPAVSRAGPVPPWAESEHDVLNPTASEVAAVLDAVDDAEASHAPSASAVLLPLIWHADRLDLVLTRRSSWLSRDPGMISFPGGRREPGEAPLETALREAEEEIGLARSAVTVLGALRVAERPSDRTRVAPFVGLITGQPELAPNADEVELIIEVPLAALFGGGVAWQELWVRGDTERAMHFFAGEHVLGDDIVWGLSARILWDLLVRLWAASRPASS